MHTFNWWEIEGQGSGPENTDYTIDTSPTLIHFTWLKLWKLVSSKTDGFLAPYRNIFCMKGVCQHVHLLASMAMRVDVTFVSTAQGCSLHVQELHSKSTLDLLWMCCDLRKDHTCMPPLNMTSPMDMKLLLTGIKVTVCTFNPVSTITLFSFHMHKKLQTQSWQN